MLKVVELELAVESMLRKSVLGSESRADCPVDHFFGGLIVLFDDVTDSRVEASSLETPSA